MTICKRVFFILQIEYFRVLRGESERFLAKNGKIFLLAYHKVYLFIHRLPKKNFEIRSGSDPKRDISRDTKQSMVAVSGPSRCPLPKSECVEVAVLFTCSSAPIWQCRFCIDCIDWLLQFGSSQFLELSMFHRQSHTV